MTLVYLRESRRRRKERGITMSLLPLVDYLSLRADDLHKGRNPELPVNQERDVARTRRESSNNARHQISDDDKVADSHAEALDRNRSVKDDGQVRICHLRQCRKRHMAPVNIPRASRLEVETKACCCTRPRDDKDAEEDAHFRERGRHGKEAGTENCTWSISVLLWTGVVEAYWCSPG
jgi:hypothetical protein